MRPADWIIEVVERTIEAMGLGRWEVCMHVKADMQRMAVVDMQPEYEVACLSIDESVTEDRRGRGHILHEVAHLQHSPLYAAHEYVLALVPEEHRDLAKRMLDDADELVIQREAVAWERALYADNRGCTRAESCGIMSEADAGQEPPAGEGDD